MIENSFIKEICGRSVKAVIGLHILIFFIPLSNIHGSALANPLYGVNAKLDVYNGAFLPDNMVVADGQTQLSFRIEPEYAISDASISISSNEISYHLGGELEWHGDVAANEELVLDFTVDPQEDLESYVAAIVSSSKFGPSVYYLHVLPNVEKMAEEPILTRGDAPKVTFREKSSIKPLADTITVMGEFYYEYYDYWTSTWQEKPVSKSTVVLYDLDGTKSTIIDTAATDSDGKYSFTVENNDGSGQGGLDVYVGIKSENYAAVVKSSSSVYQALSSMVEDVEDGTIVDFGVLVPAEKNEAWEALDSVLEAYDWIYENSGWSRSQMSVVYPSGNWPYFTGGGSGKIVLPTKNYYAWDAMVVHHEYGHAMMYSAYGNSLPSGKGPKLHYPFSESSPGFAMTEGWAEFMQVAVGNVPSKFSYYYEEKLGDAETNDWHNWIDAGDLDGEIVEGSLASIFWDIYDPANEDHDELELGFDEIWDVMKKKPKSMSDFWSKWVKAYPEYKGQSWVIFYEYGIKNGSPPKDVLIANAGTDKTVDEGRTVTLDGSESSGLQITYLWTQIAGTEVVLSDSTAAKPTFTAPDVDEITTLTFQLQASDAEDSSSDTVNIVVKPIIAGSFAVNQEGTAVLKKAKGSFEAGDYTVSVQLVGSFKIVKDKLQFNKDAFSGSVSLAGQTHDLDVKKFTLSKDKKSISYSAKIVGMSGKVTGTVKFASAIDFENFANDSSVVGKSTLKTTVGKASFDTKKTSTGGIEFS